MNLREKYTVAALCVMIWRRRRNLSIKERIFR